MAKKHLFLWGLAVLVISAGWFDSTTSLAYSPKQIYQKAGPGVVFIFASKGGSKGSGGTGSIISKDGLVITNAHIFKQNDSTQLLTDISVFLKPPRVTGNHKTDLAKGFKGKILAYDIPLDLALVKIIGVNAPLTTVNFADSEMVAIGEQVFAIGHPEQGGLWSLTTGVISAYWSDYGGVTGKNLFQTDASINRGNSGGPLLDNYGDMIGINSMIARKAADGLTITDVNFSIRSSVALDWLGKNGYRFSVVQARSEDAAEKPEALPVAPEKVTAAPEKVTVAPEKVTAAPAEPEKKTAGIPKKAPATPEQETNAAGSPQKEPQETSELLKDDKPAPSPKKSEPEKVEPTPPVKKKPPAPKDPSEDMIAQKPDREKILTEKKPYRMDDLLEGMREMEDMMEEMKDMMDDFKKRRKQ